MPASPQVSTPPGYHSLFGGWLWTALVRGFLVWGPRGGGPQPGGMRTVPAAGARCPRKWPFHRPSPRWSVTAPRQAVVHAATAQLQAVVHVAAVLGTQPLPPAAPPQPGTTAQATSYSYKKAWWEANEAAMNETQPRRRRAAPGRRRPGGTPRTRRAACKTIKARCTQSAQGEVRLVRQWCHKAGNQRGCAGRVGHGGPQGRRSR